MTPADLKVLRQALHDASSKNRQRRMDSEMGLRYLVKKYGVEKVEEAKANIVGGGKV